jgi:hypothetical protein
MVDIFLLYTVIGLVSGLCFEYLMYKTNLSDKVTNIERVTWVAFWPFYVLIFFFSIRK